MRQIYRFDRTHVLVDISATIPDPLLPREIIDIQRTSGIPHRGFVNHGTHGYLSCTRTHPPAAEFKRLTGAVSRE